MQHYLLLAIVLITIAGIFLTRYNTLVKDAEAGPAEFSPAEWFRHTAIEMGFNVLFFVAICLGINIDFITKMIDTGTETGAEANLLTIGGAIATGTLIQRVVQNVIMPIIAKITGAATARKKLREKTREATTDLVQAAK
jgi:hypothetical protein